MSPGKIQRRPHEGLGEEPDAAVPLPLANFVALGSGELFARIVAFVVTATLTRRLGATGFGELAFATAITSYLVLVPNMALQDLGIRAIAREPGAASTIIANVARVRLVLGLCGIITSSLLALALPSSASVKALVALTGLAVIPQAINSSWGHKALERTRSVGVGLVLAQVVCLVGVYVFIRRIDDLLWVPVVQATGELAAAALLLPLLLRGWHGGSFSKGMIVVRGAGTVVLSRLLRAVIVTADMVLLGLLVRSEQVGFYSAAYRVCFLLTAIAASAHVVFQPALMRAHTDAGRAASVLTDAVLMAWTVGLPLVAGGMILAPDLLALLFGESFRAGQTAFRILLFSTGLLFLHGALHGAYLARHRLGLQTWVMGAAAALNLLLNALLIVPFGIVGAAIATAAAELLILVSNLIVLRRWHWGPNLRVLARPTLAAMGMSAGLLLVPPSWHIPVRIGAAGVTYVVLLAIVGGLPPQLRQPLQRLFARG